MRVFFNPLMYTLCSVWQELSRALPAKHTPFDDTAWCDLMQAFQRHTHVRRLAVCFKTRDERGVQKRWSGVSIQRATGRVRVKATMHTHTHTYTHIHTHTHTQTHIHKHTNTHTHTQIPFLLPRLLAASSFECHFQRGSVIVDGSGVHSTLPTPVFHTPKDECGGGSAWAAGILDWCVLSPHHRSQTIRGCMRAHVLWMAATTISPASSCILHPTSLTHTFACHVDFACDPAGQVL